jgi:hypothetical protein
MKLLSYHRQNLTLFTKSCQQTTTEHEEAHANERHHNGMDTMVVKVEDMLE